MNFRERLEIAHQVMVDKGVPESSQDGLVHILLRRVGVEIPPPCFCSFSVNVVAAAVPFALFVGGINWMLVGSLDNLMVSKVLLEPLFGGAVIGALVAALARRAKRKHDLPDWSELRQPADIFD